MSGLGDHQVSIGGQTWAWRYSFRALGALQQHWQVSSIEAVIARLVSGQMGTDDLVAVIWAGLRTHHPEVTTAAVLDWLDGLGIAGLPLVVRELQSAILVSMPATDQGGEAGPDATPHPPQG